MTIDLSQFVGKQVKATFQNEETHFGKIVLGYKDVDQIYKLILPDNTYFSYFVDGIDFYQANEYNIVKIELAEPVPIKPTNKLNPKTWNNIASALTPDAIKYIESHDKYAEVMINLIEDFVEESMGITDGELPFMIFDRIFLNKIFLNKITN